MIKRSSGVLLNISSLPGEFGVGGFSADCVEFATRIADMGFSWWQVLPLTTIGDGDSPYSGVSAFALNYLYVDPYRLCEKGLIEERSLDRFRYYEPYQVDYPFVRAAKKELLRTAYAAIGDDIRAEMAEYYKQNIDWLRDYAVYMTLADRNEGKSWRYWPDEWRIYDKKRVSAFAKQNAADVDYYVFEQYILDAQWARVRREVAGVGVGIIGDIPMYVGYDSVDVWANKEQFLLDGDLKPVIIAGVPADDYSAEGQLWGNPVYNVARMKRDGYRWWIRRLERCFAMYDCLRIDHFRGLYQFYACEADAKNALNGKWYDGLGRAFINKVKSHFGDGVNIIAEDLGQIDDDVRAFLADSGFPGMRVLQFGFSESDSLHQPHNYTENCVAYTATHDNNTTLAWLYSLSDWSRNRVLNYCGYYGHDWGKGGRDSMSVKACMRSILSSVATLAIVPVQDMCGFGADTRMNTPGVPEGNWRFRLTYNALYDADRDFFREINDLYCRTPKR